MNKIYTGNGDFGFTSLPKMHKKISKTEFVFEILGTFDELEVCLGFLHSAQLGEVRKMAVEVQKDLLSLGSIISSGEKISRDANEKWEKRIKELEEMIDYFEAKNDPIKNFVLPGGCRESSFLHLARVTCRKLERMVFSYLKKNKDKAFIGKYLNRLSDLLFVMSRYSNKRLGFEDKIWNNKE
ncbi:MAG TPA: cob(I)yrinic acid a,c-diamide adenosyltransferase [bacterium]|jgi:cob(I)alamin adenosyltransferase|nr:cob(I)yrinic acid a,c-diamide adenosyltransferase [bacterium]